MTFDEWFDNNFNRNEMWNKELIYAHTKAAYEAAYEAGAKAEREACIEICDKIINSEWANADDIQTAEYISDEMRERGE